MIIIQIETRIHDSSNTFISGITEIILNFGHTKIQYSIQSIPHIEWTPRARRSISLHFHDSLLLAYNKCKLMACDNNCNSSFEQQAGAECI